jgi:hypothetical protein
MEAILISFYTLVVLYLLAPDLILANNLRLVTNCLLT